jgi:hypothetical protein
MDVIVPAFRSQALPQLCTQCGIAQSATFGNFPEVYRYAISARFVVFMGIFRVAPPAAARARAS